MSKREPTRLRVHPCHPPVAPHNPLCHYIDVVGNPQSHLVGDLLQAGNHAAVEERRPASPLNARPWGPTLRASLLSLPSTGSCHRRAPCRPPPAPGSS